MDLLMDTRHRRYILSLVVTALIVSAAHTASAKSKAAAAAKPNPEVVASSFQTFCEEWMHKLQVREHDNISNLKARADRAGGHGWATQVQPE